MKPDPKFNIGDQVQVIKDPSNTVYTISNFSYMPTSQTWCYTLELSLSLDFKLGMECDLKLYSSGMPGLGLWIDDANIANSNICTCGAHKTYGMDCQTHMDWCDYEVQTAQNTDDTGGVMSLAIRNRKGYSITR